MVVGPHAGTEHLLQLPGDLLAQLGVGVGRGFPRLHEAGMVVEPAGLPIDQGHFDGMVVERHRDGGLPRRLVDHLPVHHHGRVHRLHARLQGGIPPEIPEEQGNPRLAGLLRQGFQAGRLDVALDAATLHGLRRSGVEPDDRRVGCPPGRLAEMGVPAKRHHRVPDEQDGAGGLQRLESVQLIQEHFLFQVRRPLDGPDIPLRSVLGGEMGGKQEWTPTKTPESDGP